MTYKANNQKSTYKAILSQMTTIARMVAMCDRMIREGKDVAVAKINKAQYQKKAADLQKKVDTFPYKLGTPHHRSLCDPFTHARIVQRFDGYRVDITPDFEMWIHATTEKSEKEAMEYINK